MQNNEKLIKEELLDKLKKITEEIEEIYFEEKEKSLIEKK